MPTLQSLLARLTRPSWLPRLPPAVPIALRSMGVGSVATAVDLATLTLLVSGLGVSASSASAPALVLGMATQFVGTKRFAFRDASRAWLRQALAFGAVETLGLLANLALFELALRFTDLPYLAARLGTTTVVYFTVCLPLWSRIFEAPRALVPGVTR